MARVLHVLSQRPSLTGSGITLDALVRHAEAAGWEQRVVVGVPADRPRPDVGGLHPDRIDPLPFGKGDLDFPVPGMSDIMPYPSSRFSSLTETQLDRYRGAWRRHLGAVIERFRPDLIHSHHLWVVSSLVKDLAPDTPVVTQCHATGFRQMQLCPDLAEQVRTGCRRNDRFVVLHRGHADQLARTLDVPSNRIDVVGAGYREELFHARDRRPDLPPRLLFIGKYSAAKGLPWLLDAFDRLRAGRPDLALHVAGSGAGEEAEQLRIRMVGMAPAITLHGQLPQDALAELMRQSTICVLPSLYEGLPLVLVEALACGCRLVSTALPGVVEQLAPHLGDALQLVSLPRLIGVDTPDPDDLPAFVDRLVGAIERTLSRPALGDPVITLPGALAEMTWAAVFRRIEPVWNQVLGR